MPNSPSSTRSILKDTVHKAVVQFATDDNTGTGFNRGEITGSISASELIGYQQTRDSTKIGISKISWNCHYGDPYFSDTESVSWGIYWGMTGSTGTAAVIVSGVGELNFKHTLGFPLTNTLTGNYNNTINIFNLNQTQSTTGKRLNLILEIDKISGFGLTQAT